MHRCQRPLRQARWLSSRARCHLHSRSYSRSPDRPQLDLAARVRALAGTLAKREDTDVRILMGDAVGAATGQVVPEGYYHLDRLLTSALRHGAQVALCGACMNARALDESEIVEGAKRSSLEELSEWTLWADNVVTFSEERGQVRTSRVGRASRDAGLIRLP